MADIAELIKGLTPEQIQELKVVLGVKKAKVPKEQSPEYIEAKAELDSIASEAPDLIARYEAAKEKMRGVKGTRVVHATKGYKFDLATGAITDAEGNAVATFGEDGWQSKMRAAGFTAGQVAAVSKKVRGETNKAAA